MRTLYIVLLILAVVCFAVAAVLTPEPTNAVRLRLVALGLALFAAVPLVEQIHAASNS